MPLVLFERDHVSALGLPAANAAAGTIEAISAAQQPRRIWFRVPVVHVGFRQVVRVNWLHAFPSGEQDV